MTTRRTVLLSAEAALLALTVLATISLERLFSDNSFLPELLIMVVGSHLVAAVCRRAELSMVWATPISGLALIVLGTAVFYPEVSTLIVPSSETVTTLGDDLRLAWQTFSDDAAPVPPLRGFVVTTAVLVWYGVFLADWAAFRLRSPFEAVAPAISVFVFAALLGVDRNQIAHGITFSLGLLGALLTLRAERQVREEVWVAGGDGAGARTTLRIGATAGIIAVVVAAVVAPQLPGASAEPLVDITEINTGPRTREVISPLVEISASLVQQTDTELFSVRVAEGERDYWRLMALTSFEDEIWKRRSNFDDARGPVERTVDSAINTHPVTQEITIAALGNIYLPAAYEISEVIESDAIGLEYEAATGALVVERKYDEIPRGLSYIVESRVPDYRAEDLPASASAGLDDGFLREHTQLPSNCGPDEEARLTGCWPTGVTEEAERIVRDAGATTDYERVLALQSFFLDNTRFTYDLDAGLEHSINDMNTFLQIGRGYCEQFASTFAAMARSLGIPSRVAVGFTWGEWNEARGEYIVRGKHAHAWPEIYFDGVGWVIFDPTPGRSRGTDSAITTVSAAEQVGSQDEPAGPAVTVPDPRLDEELGTDARATPGGPAEPVLGEDTAAPIGADGSSNRGRQILLGVAATVIALIAFVPVTQMLRRRRRLARVASDPVGRGELAWDDALGSLRLLGLQPSPDQTPLEFAAVVAQTRRDLGPLPTLAEEVTLLRYSDAADDITHAVAAQNAAGEIVRRVRAQVGPRRVLGDALDPRTLLRPAPAPAFAR